MATFDAKKNLAYSTVGTAPVPADSGTTLIVNAGDGTKFPAVPFNATVWPTGVQPTIANAEIVRVTNIAVDTFTITRQQEGTAARTILATDQISATITAKALTDIEAAFTSMGALVAPVGVIQMWLTGTPPTSWLVLDGSAVSRATYSDLFTLWGVTFGAGDGATTFNLPDMRQRIPIGKTAAGALSTLGTLTGSWDHTHGPGTLTVAAHTHGPGTLTVAAHTHASGTLQVASHSHGAGTLSVASHTHDGGTYSTDNVNLAHTHSMQNHFHDMGNHTHTGTTDTEPVGAVAGSDGAGVDVVANHAHDFTTNGPSTNNTSGPSVADTGSALSTHSHSITAGSSGATAPAVSGGSTATTAPLVNAGATASTTPAVNAGTTASASPAVDAGVTGTNNPPVIVVNFIVRALPTV